MSKYNIVCTYTVHILCNVHSFLFFYRVLLILSRVCHPLQTFPRASIPHTILYTLLVLESMLLFYVKLLFFRILIINSIQLKEILHEIKWFLTRVVIYAINVLDGHVH